MNALLKTLVALWHYPMLDGSTMPGINDGTVGNFHKWRDFFRELCQNTNDMWREGADPVLIRFARERHRLDNIPGLREILNTIGLCRKSWEFDPNAVKFLEEAAVSLMGDFVDCMRVSDFFTGGAPGDDKDKTSPWCKLARMTGSTSKFGGEGGSHGVGKTAALAASKVRVAYYSTLTGGGHRFVGTSLLTSFEDAQKVERNNRWFFGGPGGASIANPADIPSLFLRKQAGLDTFVPAFTFDHGWTDDAAAVVIESFWPAIQNGRLVCEIVDGKEKIVISKDTLPALLQTYRETTDAHIYHSAYTNPEKRRDFDTPQLGRSSVWVSFGEGLNNRFALVRKNGMVIEEKKFESRIKVAGVFECSDERGNELLRKMETSTHDRWEPSKLPGTGRQVEAEYKGNIRKAIIDATAPDGAESGSVTGLENLLPMEGCGPGMGKSPKNRGTPRMSQPPKPATPSFKRNRVGGYSKGVQLLARVVGSGGRYSLKVEHPRGAKDAYLAVGIAGDHGVNLTKIKRAKASDGTPIATSDDRFGPVKLNKGTTSFDVTIKDRRRLAFAVYAIEKNKEKAK